MDGTIVGSGRPAALRQLNVARIVNRLQVAGPLSRAELARQTGVSFPTVAKICEALGRERLIETDGDEQKRMGRPAKTLRMAASRGQVLAVTIGPEQTRLALAGLDGRLQRQQVIAGPDSYEALIDAIVDGARSLRVSSRAKTLGLGVALPGVIAGDGERVSASPNVPVLVGRHPKLDLQRRMGIPVVMTESMRAAFLAERIRGGGAELDDFAVLNYRGGMGLAAASRGQLVLGGAGMAGELGHVVAIPDGLPCACGNRGCIETVATDLALARSVSRRLGRTFSVEEVVALAATEPDRIAGELKRCLDYLAMAVGLVINVYNPRAVFLLGRVLQASDEVFESLLERVPRYCVPQLAAQCRVSRTQADTLQGAALAIAQDLVDLFCRQESSS